MEELPEQVEQQTVEHSREVPWPGLDSELVCIIPARGQSKRLPNKNLLGINGRALIGYVIETAKASGLFGVGGVWVSTEDADIALVANRWGANVIDRPKELATDGARLKDVVIHALDWLDGERKKYGGKEIKYVCIMLPTAILPLPEDVEIAWNVFDQTLGADGIMAVTRPMEHPDMALCYTPVHVNAGGKRFVIDDALGLRDSGVKEKHEQELQELLVDAGQFYFYNVLPFKWGGFYPMALLGYKLPRTRSIDINTQEDFEIARLLLLEQMKARPRKV